MSTPYFSWAWPVEPGRVPAREPTFDDLGPFMNQGVGANRTVASASRNGWLNGNLLRLSSRFAEGAFDFLAPNDRVPHADRSNALWIVSTFDAPAIGRLIGGVERLLERARTDPAALAALLDPYDAADIVAALDASSAAVNDVAMPHGEEEGDGPVYLFSYLKALLSLLRYAGENGLSVVHANHCHS
jgi:hypothetical protein